MYHMELEDQIVHEGDCDCIECTHTKKCIEANDKSFIEICICEVDLS